MAGGYFLNAKGFDSILVNILLLIAGFVMLIKGADYFVEGASGIADKFGIPQIVIGLTIVAFGTSAPEAAVSITSALQGSTGLAIGNVVGSNIMNVLLILGISATITKMKVEKSTAKIEIPFVIFITTVLVVMGGLQGELNLLSGLILLALFVVFFIYLIYTAKKGMSEGNDNEDEVTDTKKKSIALLLVFTIFGMLGIVAGSDVTVDSASYVAMKLGMDDRLIGLTIVAFGTSLPELVTSIIASVKGNADIAIGNVVGSNIFNILFVLGVTAVIKTVNYDAKFVIDGIIAIAAVVLLFVSVIRKKELGRMAGIIMLVGYAAYFAYLIMG
ncbi:MAG: calcium/sodium antiporter [Lachnospiraceae bacterium]|nr:calcium/sodium antiporter [Lachnospiraceae bacterium]